MAADGCEAGQSVGGDNTPDRQRETSRPGRDGYELGLCRLSSLLASVLIFLLYPLALSPSSVSAPPLPALPFYHWRCRRRPSLAIPVAAADAAAAAMFRTKRRRTGERRWLPRAKLSPPLPARASSSAYQKPTTLGGVQEGAVVVRRHAAADAGGLAGEHALQHACVAEAERTRNRHGARRQGGSAEGRRGRAATARAARARSC